MSRGKVKGPIDKLALRGYDRAVCSRMLWQQVSRARRDRSGKTVARQAYFTTLFSSTVNARVLRTTLKSGLQLLPSQFQLNLAWRVQRNDFLRRYRQWALP